MAPVEVGKVWAVEKDGLYRRDTAIYGADIYCIHCCIPVPGQVPLWALRHVPFRLALCKRSPVKLTRAESKTQMHVDCLIGRMPEGHTPPWEETKAARIEARLTR